MRPRFWLIPILTGLTAITGCRAEDACDGDGDCASGFVCTNIGVCREREARVIGTRPVVDAGVVPDMGFPDAAGPPPGVDAGPPDAGQAFVCHQPQPLPANGIEEGSLVGEDNDERANCYIQHGVDKVWEFTVPGDFTRISVSVETDFLVQLLLFENPCIGGQQIVCDFKLGDAAADFTDLPAGTYDIVLDGVRNIGDGNYRLTVEGEYVEGASCDPALEWMACPGDEQCIDGTCQMGAPPPPPMPELLADDAACDPESRVVVCDSGLCRPGADATMGTCVQARDCMDGFDSDGDNETDEDAAACTMPPTVTCAPDAVIPIPGQHPLMATFAEGGSPSVSQRWLVDEAPAGTTPIPEISISSSVSVDLQTLGTYRIRYRAVDANENAMSCVTTLTATTS